MSNISYSRNGIKNIVNVLYKMIDIFISIIILMRNIII